MKYRIAVTHRFKKDIKKCQKRHLPMEVSAVLHRLAEGVLMMCKYFPPVSVQRYIALIVKNQRERDILKKMFGDILKISYICKQKSLG